MIPGRLESCRVRSLLRLCARQPCVGMPPLRCGKSACVFVPLLGAVILLNHLHSCACVATTHPRDACLCAAGAAAAGVWRVPDAVQAQHCSGGRAGQGLARAGAALHCKSGTGRAQYGEANVWPSPVGGVPCLIRMQPCLPDAMPAGAAWVRWCMAHWRHALHADTYASLHAQLLPLHCEDALLTVSGILWLAFLLPAVRGFHVSRAAPLAPGRRLALPVPRQRGGRR